MTKPMNSTTCIPQNLAALADISSPEGTTEAVALLAHAMASRKHSRGVAHAYVHVSVWVPVTRASDRYVDLGELLSEG